MNIDGRDFREVDLNLLVTVEVLMRERHIARAPPTPWASARPPPALLWPGCVVGALRKLSEVLFEEPVFDPHASARAFVLAISDDVEARGMRRRIIGSTTHFAGALTPLKTAEVIVTLPRHAAEAFAVTAGLTLCEAPIPTPRFTVSMAWTAQRENDPAQQWLRGVVRDRLGG